MYRQKAWNYNRIAFVCRRSCQLASILHIHLFNKQQLLFPPKETSLSLIKRGWFFLHSITQTPEGLGIFGPVLLYPHL
jgi:hypothetical protein